MSDLISKQDAICEVLVNDGTYNIVDRIKSLPSADAVEVVRCKDCKHRDPEDGRCDHGAVYFMDRRTDNDFCSYGERREDGE